MKNQMPFLSRQLVWSFRLSGPEYKPTHTSENLQSGFYGEVIEKTAYGALTGAMPNICLQGRMK